jgi:hypothetical protein
MLHARAFEWLRELTKRTNRQNAESRPRTMGVAS